jgi:predicted RNA-binding Zn ribbon-like protein
VQEFRTGNGAAWLDLLATLKNRYRASPIDALESPTRLRAWLRQNALEPAGPVTEGDLTQVREVREALHRAAAAAVRNEPPKPGDIRLLGTALRADRPVRVRSQQSRLVLARPATTAEALARLTRDAVADLSGPRREQLRACGDDTCSGIFLDPTGRRRWCSDQTCGNRLRVRAHRSRVRPA